MRAIVFEQKLSRHYYLGYLPCYGSYRWDEERPRRVNFEDIHVSWEKCYETNEYIREFSCGEFLNIKGETYQIVLVSHDEDGSINYRINKKTIIRDEESKIKTETEYTEYLSKEKYENEKDQTKKNGELEKLDDVDYAFKLKNHNKKWYQFWKE